MPRRFLLTFLLGLALAGFSRGQDEGKQDAARLQGAWSITHMKAKKGAADEFLLRGKVTFRGDRMTIALGEEILAEHVCAIWAGDEPRRIDVTHAEGPYKGLTWQGIYLLDGDELKLLFSPPGKKAPVRWPVKGSQLNKVVVLKRANP